MSKRTKPLPIAPAVTPQKPNRHYWTVDSALPISPEALDRLVMQNLDMHSQPVRAKLEAALLTQFQEIADNVTDGRKAAMVNIMSEFLRMVSRVVSVEMLERDARTGTANDPFMGRVLSR